MQIFYLLINSTFVDSQVLISYNSKAFSRGIFLLALISKANHTYAHIEKEANRFILLFLVYCNFVQNLVSSQRFSFFKYV